MSTKPTTYDPSPFWVRLEEAIGRFYRPFNANNLAVKLGMRQSAVNRWYIGRGKPSMELALEFARKGGVHVEWLLTGAKPKHPISKDPLLRELFELCEQLDASGDGRQQVLRAARNELLAQTELQRQEAERQKRRSGT
jgi:transcriptional regulator with XRE-family HTH domain